MAVEHCCIVVTQKNMLLFSELFDIMVVRIIIEHYSVYEIHNRQRSSIPLLATMSVVYHINIKSISIVPK